MSMMLFLWLMRSLCSNFCDSLGVSLAVNHQMLSEEQSDQHQEEIRCKPSADALLQKCAPMFLFLIEKHPV